MTSIPTTLSTISSHPVAEELTEELDQLLDVFCSDVQQQFCLDQHVATQHQLSNIKQTIQQARALLNGKWLLDSQQQQNETTRQSHIQIRQSVMRTCLEMIDSYQAIAHQRQLRNLPDGQATKWMHVDWQQLSQRFDTKAREQTQWTQLLTNLKELQKAWEKKPQQQVNKIIHSFLMTTFDPPTGCHIVVVDRHNYAQLGLKRKAIGSRQLVFECHLLSRQDQMAIIADLCQRFATVFGENAHHNLAHIDAQLKRGEPHDLHLKCQALYHELFLPLDLPSPSLSSSAAAAAAAAAAAVANKSSRHSTDDHHNPPPQPTSYLDSLQQQRVDQWYANQDQQQHLDDDQQEMDLPPTTPPPPPPPPTTTTTTAHQQHHHPYLSHDIPPIATAKSPPPPVVPMTLRPTPFIDTTSLTLQHIPLPSFIPSPWQWPDLLKIRQPYRPILFGLIKRRKKNNLNGGNGGGFFFRLYHLFYSPRKQPSMTFVPARPTTTANNNESTLSNNNNNNNNTNNNNNNNNNNDITTTTTAARPSSPPASLPAPIIMYPMFASISMGQLGQHFIWTSQRFYQDIMLHCQLKYQQDSEVLKEIGSDLVQMYAALQLDISRLAMQRIVTILHELHTMDPPVASVDAADVAAAATTPPPSPRQHEHPSPPPSVISLEGV
ncbi:hypothetical protein BCR42DRAFT_428390 [Absidia repens]|uniref:Uncharacterized protein n=1 Tax=Absidia repens TaxID=90262 RepID=A0A1X2HY58_9FUNG|nr:hypothetical protein BCR42DRAFT_428390 [Absidia repens]